MNEEFVPFELAKKLQEKGFDWQTFDWYDHLGNFNKGFIPRTLRGCPMHREYYAPTIGLAMKWLREEKNLSVEVLISVRGGWYNIIYEIAPRRGFDLKHMLIEAKSYEEAAIAGIEFCLDNLI